ncbi:MAG TPA: JAB domain-containing protein [Thermodesulfatator sp.]|nr:JAB domain-containing protein [Thermodesulfatator sp.]
MDKEDWQRRGAGHRQRLREKFMEYGLSAFTDAEILEVLLSFGTPRKDCKVPARKALQHFKGLAQVLEAPVEELVKIPGLGPKNIFALKFVQGVARRYLERRIKEKVYLRSAREVYEYLYHSMADLKKEVFKAIYLDARGAILAVEDLFRGTVNMSHVYPRELIERTLRHNASALVVAHNHPSGDTTPSREDLHLTRRLIIICEMLEIRLLDHLIIGHPGKYYSFAERGLMDSLREEVRRALL